MDPTEAVDVANPPGSGSSRRQSSKIALALAIPVFALHLAFALRLDGLGVFNQQDVFFNADVAVRVRCMVENDCRGRSSFSHPNLALFVNPPLQAAAGVLTLGGLTGIDRATARRFVALCVSPLASALKAPVVFFVLLGLGVSIGQAGLLAALSVVSFSQLVFGSIPESFALSGLAIALTYLLAIRTMRRRDRRLWPWILVGVLTAGITVSNLVVVVVLFTTARLHAGERLRAVLARVAIVVGLVLLPTAALPTMFRDAYRLEEVSIEGGTQYTERWLKTHRIVNRVLATPSAWAHTFAAPEPGLGHNLPARLMASRYQYRFIMAHREDVFCFRDPLGFLFVLLFVAGALGYLGAPAHARWMCGASLVIIAFNWMLHSAWGVDLILYSQHWQLSLLVLLAGLFLWSESLARGVSLLFVGLILAVVLQNANTASSMLSTLQSDHRGSSQHSSPERRQP
jgi:hypothetical protein